MQTPIQLTRRPGQAGEHNQPYRFLARCSTALAEDRKVFPLKTPKPVRLPTHALLAAI